MKKSLATVLGLAFLVSSVLPSSNVSAAGLTRTHVIVSMERSGTSQNMHGGYMYSQISPLTGLVLTQIDLS